MNYVVFDIETDGLIDSVTKIHCLSYNKFINNLSVEKNTLTSFEEIKTFIEKEDSILVGHNIVRYDIPVLKKFGIVPSCSFIDTLALSWYLEPRKAKHGLEYYGEDFENEKIEILDWENLSIEDYIKRCERDVEINVELFQNQLEYLLNLYSNEGEVIRLARYLAFKFDCLREQEEYGIKLDTYNCNKYKNDLEYIIEEKRTTLIHLMPKELGKTIKTKPKVMYKQDGTLTSHGISWNTYLTENNLPLSTEEVKEAPNPGSHKQLKSWLLSLGWEPETYKESKATGERIPQVSLPFGNGLCHSVKKLYEKEPNLKELENYYMYSHRLGLVKSFLKNVKPNGYIYSTAHGFTNTLRIMHSQPVVNLPGIEKPYGTEIRSCLTVPDEHYTMCGFDISSLEDNTKQHYIYYFDPEYVKEMRVPGFDPHLDIALLAHLVTQEEVDFYKWFDKLSDEDKLKFTEEELDSYNIKFKEIKSKRYTAKTSNFAITYNAFPPKIAEVAKISLSEAQHLFDVYWQRNKAIKSVVDNCQMKTVNGTKWIKNPISGFWLYLKEEKDAFSTLNQSSGSYVFDTLLKHVRSKLISMNIPIVMQYHDEGLTYFKKEQKDLFKQKLNEAVIDMNKELKLNVEIGISISFGNNYADCH